MKTKCAAILLAVGISGCLDLELMDEMLPLDGGLGQTAGAEAADETGGTPELDANDTNPPALVTPECASSEETLESVCVAKGPISASVRFFTDEPASVAVIDSGAARAAVLSQEWADSHHIGFASLDSKVETAVSLEVADVNGNVLTVDVPLMAAGGVPVAITEVLADPFGTEPDQEFVEIANVGDEPVDLSGWSVDDGGDANGDLIPNGEILGPGEVAIVVSSAYDPNEGQDPPPSAGTLLIRLETSVGSNGLKNSEAESVELYDAQGVVVSRYRGQAGDPVEGAGAIRIAAELPDGDPAAFAVDLGGTSTPGEAPTLP